MINLYFYRENVNVNRFIYENIKGNSLILVPEQFTLQAERDALFYMQKEGLLDIEITSPTTFARKVGGRVGVPAQIIDSQGRHMLMARVLRSISPDLKIFSGYENKADFVGQLVELIEEFKEGDISADKLAETAVRLGEKSSFVEKLKEINFIFKKYEEAVGNNYMDSQDFITYAAENLDASGLLKNRTVIVYGFDSLSQKNMEIFEKVAALSLEFNIFITGTAHMKDSDFSFFSLGEKIKKQFVYVGEKYGIECSLMDIPEQYKDKRPEAIDIMEKDLFKEDSVNPCQKKFEELKLVIAPRAYEEIKNVAYFVQYLTRYKGYRYRDIDLICNDLDNMGSLCKRIFAGLGMDIFIDAKRGITHSCIITYVICVLDIINKGLTVENLLTLAKTGLTKETDEDIESLEAYCREYGIKGKNLRDSFYKGSNNPDYELEKIEETRVTLVTPLLSLRDFFFKENENTASSEKKRAVRGRKMKAEEMSRKLISYLKKDVNIEKAIENLVRKQIDRNHFEAASETKQVWDEVISVIKQLVEICGDELLDRKEFCQTVVTGIQLTDIGIVPPTVDGLILGNLSRSRRTSSKVTIILGANEGILPKESGTNVILNQKERERLIAEGCNLCRSDAECRREEILALYRSIAGTEEILYISCSAGDKEGKKQEPAYIFNDIVSLFPNQKLYTGFADKDLSPEDMGINSGTLNFLTRQILFSLESGKEISKEVRGLYQYFKKDKNFDQGIWAGLDFSNDMEQLSPDDASALYIRDEEKLLRLSPSRMELFGNCPFAHFMRYGIKVEEPREYAVKAVDVGSIYHRCMKKVTDELNGRKKFDSDMSPWKDAEEKYICDIVDREIELEAKNYREGLLISDYEAVHRMEGIKRIAEKSAWQMVLQVKEGKITEILAEVGFGPNRKFKEVMPVEDKDNIIIQGQIDRVDYTQNRFCKVIDYKSGSDSFSRDSVLGGLKLQLLIYLLAASQGKGDEGIRPGGAFFFKVGEKISDDPEEMLKYIGKNNKEMGDSVEEYSYKYKLDGFMIDDGAFKEDLGTVGKIAINSKERTMEEEIFSEFLQAGKEKIKEMALALYNGDIRVQPCRRNGIMPCEYCNFRGICYFDKSIPGCNIRIV